MTTATNSTAAGALPVSERIAALDVVRGVAVGGILLANVLVFFGHDFMPAELAESLPSAAVDRVALFLGHLFVDAKFYSVFSLLFGIGFGLWLARGGEAALPRFRRRLRVLLAIGALHAFLLWAGDILMLYALLGFTMPWFARKSDHSLLKWVVGLLAMPTTLYLLAIAIRMVLTGSAAASADSMGVPPSLLGKFEAIGTGGVIDAFIGNGIFLLGRWADLLVSIRIPKVLGMFVLGLWTVRAGIALAPAAHRAMLVRWAWRGLGIGLPANLIAAWGMEHWDYLPPSLGGLVAVAMQAIGVPLLAIGYAATIALLVVDGRRIVSVFAPVGRMALTNYLMHSVICVVLSYGFGFGLWWRIGAAQAMAIAAAIIAVQIPLSAWWLSHHRFGPTEYCWRRLTYGRLEET